MKNTKIILIICCLAFYSISKGQTLHAILVADTEDNLPEFAASCLADINHMKSELNVMAKAVQYATNFVEVKGKDFSTVHLRKVLNGLEADTNDVIFFYYAGAGYCEAGKPEDSRMLRLGIDNQDIISTTEIISTVESKGARLNVMLVDACALIRQVTFAGHKGDATSNVYQSLLSACGTLKVFSSKCSEYSFGDKNGGIFTNAFIGAIKHFIDLGTKDLIWKTLLEYAGKYTAQQALTIFRNQHPVFFFSEDFVDDCIR